MALITKRKILDGVYLVEIPPVDLRLLCGCPSDAIKHLALKGLLPIVEKDGVKYESGPNAILLSDNLVQKGDLVNLTEFPVLHMFYNQGMILPKHPNHGQTPIMIGREASVKAQMEYIFMGNYGLVEEEQFTSVGETPEFAREYIRMKLRFAQGRFIPSDELIHGVFLEEEPVEIKSGVMISRQESNIFKIDYLGESVLIDLNLKKYQKYRASYRLPRIKTGRHYFSIIHSGEGDGWDPNRPCLSSIIQYNGEFFLMDSGPHILATLKAFALKPAQLGGIFFTHVHDDHFAGLYSLLSRKKRLKVFATNTVRSTIVHKLMVLLTLTEEEINRYIEFIELERDSWNDYNGMEIKPVPSAHPIDTTIFIFRVKDRDGYKSYGHYSDIVALSWLKKMIQEDTSKPGVTEEYMQMIRDTFNIPVDVKKIDVGGPVVHGDAEDFARDTSGRIVMGHTHTPFTERQLEIGDEVEFGEEEILIDKPPH